MRALLFIAIFLFAGCGALTEEERLREYGPAISPEASPWIVDALDRAVGFWTRQHMKLDEYAPGGVEIIETLKLENPNGAGEYDCRHKQIRLLPSLEGKPKIAVCVVAHEIGHMFGMNHITEDPKPEGDLMDRVVEDDKYGDCPWSLKDEHELQRALAQRPTCP